jgi:hypothetical protein
MIKPAARSENGALTRHVLRFCEVAVDMGFIDKQQVKDSLDEQIANDPGNRLRPHRLIGEILFKNGWLTNEQIDLVLAKLQNPQDRS